MSADLGNVRGHIELLRYVKREKARLKEIEDGARAAIEEALGHATDGTVDGVTVVRRKTIKSKRLDQALLVSIVGEHVVEECKTVSESTRFEIL